jgi:hypothetical protein
MELPGSECEQQCTHWKTVIKNWVSVDLGEFVESLKKYKLHMEGELRGVV